MANNMAYNMRVYRKCQSLFWTRIQASPPILEPDALLISSSIVRRAFPRQNYRWPYRVLPKREGGTSILEGITKSSWHERKVTDFLYSPLNIEAGTTDFESVCLTITALHENRTRMRSQGRLHKPHVFLKTSCKNCRCSLQEILAFLYGLWSIRKFQTQ